jgi:hypothetical protein
MNPVKTRALAQPIPVDHVRALPSNSSVLTLNSGYVYDLDSIWCLAEAIITKNLSYVATRPPNGYPTILRIRLCQAILFHPQERIHFQKTSSGSSTHDMAEGQFDIRLYGHPGC